MTSGMDAIVLPLLLDFTGVDGLTLLWSLQPRPPLGSRAWSGEPCTPHARCIEMETEDTATEGTIVE